MYCKVALPIPSEQLYTYSVPEKFSGMVSRGQLVYVNLKNQNEPVAAYVISAGEECDIDPSLVRPLHDVFDSEPVPEELMALAEKVSARYFCSMGNALELVFQPTLAFSAVEVEKYYDFNRKLDVFKVFGDGGISKIERLIIQFLYNSGAQTKKDIEKTLLLDYTVSKNNIAKLAASGVIASSFNKKSFDYGGAATFNYELADSREIIYTDEQKAAIIKITENILKKEYSENLLFGVTGSGKTEVYIEILKLCVSRGLCAIVLVPEIALTEHLKHRFLKAFPEGLAVWHSLVKKEDKQKIYANIARGEIKILLGARSAIFAPFADLGCIIIDEEHDSSYKQESGIYYDTREIARMRMELANGALVMGSATPSIESYYPLENGRRPGSVIRIEKRVENRPMPRCHIVDMGLEFSENKNKSMFSLLLEEKITDRLERRQQVLLFLNRRGHSTFVLCRSCGLVIKCDDCAVSMTYHSEPPRLLCHYCNKIREVPMLCPSCQSHYIRFFGVGTEKVEEEFRRKFPEARVARLDSDVLTNKSISAKIFDDFLKKKIDVLIGTQMIAKGLDFHNITLVGIISADTALNMPDMFASEKTFQVLCQVIGRTGRGVDEGECVIQTYNADNYAITSAAVSDFKSFYANEIEVRRSLEYPPFREMIKISFEHAQETLAFETAKKFAAEVAAAAGDPGLIRMLGPAPALIARRQNVYRFNAFIFTDSATVRIGPVSEILKKYSFTNKRQYVKISVDVSPNNTY